MYAILNFSEQSFNPALGHIFFFFLNMVTFYSSITRHYSERRRMAKNIW
jgi:hypothetical protein